MDPQQRTSRTWWELVVELVVWIGGSILALGVVLVLIRIGYAYEWTGFGQSKVKEAVQPSKTLWDWLELLIIPIVLAIGGYLLTRSEARATQAAAERRAQDEALQAYLDQMSNMMIPGNDLPSLYKARPGDSLSSVARARTLTVLPRLDRYRRARVVQFLYESGLITRDRLVLDLTGANLASAQLSLATLSRAHLTDADLSFADLPLADLNHANLRHADLTDADLTDAKLHQANLSDTFLIRAKLRRADLNYANLSNAYVRHADLTFADLSNANLRHADLTDAKLHHAKLREADLCEADLSGANLRGADLSGAKEWNKEQLRQAKSLDGATMPDGQILRDDYIPNQPTFEA